MASIAMERNYNNRSYMQEARKTSCTYKFMKVYVEVAVNSHAFLPATLDESERSDSQCCHLTTD
jgi:hypothetical protein